MKNKGLVLILVMILSISMVIGCEKVENNEPNEVKNDTNKEIENKETSIYPLTIKDDFNNEILIKDEPERIVSLAPNNTEILFALGLDDKIVGVSNYDDYPKEALEKEKVGDAFNINIEKIIELNPDIVLLYGNTNEEGLKQLKDIGIKIISYEPESIEDVTEVILEIGNITNTMDEAKEIVDNINQRKNNIIDKLKDKEKVKVFYEIWNEPLMAAGPGSFIDEFINLSGGENIAFDAEGEYPQYDVEQLIERNPDVYLTSNEVETKTKDSIKNRPGYESISAMKNDRIYILDGNIISRPGPRIIDALEMVAKSIHPDIIE